MHSEYNSSLIMQLRDQQTRFAPRERKIQQIERTERLLRELDLTRNYSYEFVCYRVTGYRPENAPIVSISGEDLRTDLHCFIEDLSESADIRANELAQPVHTVADLSKMFSVSTKTISRWRQQGLVSHKIIFDCGRKRIAFLDSNVSQFVKNNREKVRRGERFSQLSDRDRDAIIQSARQLASTGACPADVARTLAGRLERSAETIRYTIKQFDEFYPDLAIFPEHAGLLNVEVKERIYADFLAGKNVGSIASRYGRTKTTIYRVCNEMRAREIMDLPLDFMDSPEFHRRAAGKKILGPMPDPEHTPRRVRPPAGLPRYLAALYETPLLTREQEAHLFRKYNFLKFRASKLRKQLDLDNAKASDMDEIQAIYDEAVEIKNQIVQANLRLVISIAKRHVKANDDFFLLVSDGNMSLIRAVEKFDYTLGNKISTYASWAIMKNYARTIPGEYKLNDRFRPTAEDLFLATQDQRTDRGALETAQNDRMKQVGRILESLDDREQKIIVSRFGLDYSQEPQTLREVGAEMGVTKERIRQIEARALSKLRAAARHDHIDFVEE